MQRSVVSVVMLIALFSGSSRCIAQDQQGVPEGARVSGSSWCVFATGKYPEFLTEVARLIDMGGEVQGVYPYEQGQWRALVCKRGRPAN